MPYFNKVIIFIAGLAVTSIAMILLLTPTPSAHAAAPCVKIASDTKATYYPDCDVETATNDYQCAACTMSSTDGVTYKGNTSSRTTVEFNASTKKYRQSGGGQTSAFRDITVYDNRSAPPPSNNNQTTSNNNQQTIEQRNAIYAAVGPSVESLKSKFKIPAGCYEIPTQAGYDSCLETGWKNAVVDCFESSLDLDETIARGTDEQVEEGHKNKFASCLSGKLNNVTPADVKDKLTNVSISGINKTTQPTTPATPADPTKSSCGIDGIGWLVCPVMSFLGDIMDSLFGVIAGFLEVSADQVSHMATRSAWESMRNIANIAFVMAFIFIIYSQLTSAGISNYGVKKMLPRIIIAAVLVNLSFIICQLAVDISNFLGYTIKGLFDSIQLSTGVGQMKDASGNGWGVAVIVVGLIAAGIGAAFAISLPVLLAALLALLLIVGILLARKAFIIILIVIAPLAFVAFLLPNTEQWFKRWQKTFFALLIVFPIISVVFGASQLVGAIVKASNTDTLTQLSAIGIAAIPLFVVPSLLKGSMNAAGAIGAKLSNLSSKANGGIGKNIKDKSMLGAYNKARGRQAEIRRAQIMGGTYRGKNPFSRAASFGNRAVNSSRWSGNMGNTVAQQAAALEKKLQIEKVEAATALIENANLDKEALAAIAQGKKTGGVNGADASTRAAAMQMQMRRGDFNELETSWNSMQGLSGKGGDEIKRTVAQTFARGDKPGFIGQSDLQGMMSDDSKVPSFQEMAAVGGVRYSAQKLASTDKDEIKYLMENQNNSAPAGSDQGKSTQALGRAANEALSNPDISGHVDGRIREHLTNMRDAWG